VEHFVTVKSEPKEAFLYQPPDDVTRERYKNIFSITEPLPPRPLKVIFDKFFAILVLTLASPVIFGLYLANLIEGFLIPENKGPFIFYYYAVSGGKLFKKYKIRLIKTKYIDQEAAKRGEWHAFLAEWTKDSRTHVGRFVKKFYLDELPQFYCVLKGDMSIVGPRPLAAHHYERDLQQGNITRKLLKGGIVGAGHVLKGKPEMGNAAVEYDYIEQYLGLSQFGLLFLDIKILWKAVFVLLEGKGL